MQKQRVRVKLEAPYWQGEEGFYFGADDKGRIQIQKRSEPKNPVVNFYVEPQFVEFL